jgi:predicted enzyme related to lactoylglutathione lyase
MSEPDGYRHGVPCWVETWQPDADGAAAFYRALFGWDTVGPVGGPYMCTLRDRDVALIGARPPERAHLPVAWTTYVWVESADEAAVRVAEAGGSVVLEPFDSLDGGRMAIVADPTGAVLGVWQPGAHRGAQIVNEPGAWSWSQLSTPNPDAARSFYVAVFDWETDAFGRSTMFRVPGYFGGEPTQPVSRDVVAGMAPVEDDDPAEWQIDFWVTDTDAAVATAEEHGGRVVAPATDSPIARTAVLADPHGAVFSVSTILIGA